MACGKPPDPRKMTRPTSLRQPVIEPARLHLRAVEKEVNRSAIGDKFDEQMRRANKSVERARQAGLKAKELQKLEKELTKLKNEGKAKICSVAGLSPKRLSPTVQKALTDPKHWLHPEFSDAIINYVKGNKTISPAYKVQLSKDIAEIIKTRPEALGIIKEASQRIKSGKAHIGGMLSNGKGAVYDVMGTAALIRKGNSGSISANTNKKLIITPQSELLFGIRVPTERTNKGTAARGTKVEQSTALWKTDGTRRTGIHFSHDKGLDSHGNGQTPTGLVESVSRAICNGQIHDYHFVSNGSFSQKFKNAIAKANEEIIRNGRELIAYHEKVI